MVIVIFNLRFCLRLVIDDFIDLDLGRCVDREPQASIKSHRSETAIDTFINEPIRIHKYSFEKDGDDNDNDDDEIPPLSVDDIDDLVSAAVKANEADEEIRQLVDSDSDSDTDDIDDIGDDAVDSGVLSDDQDEEDADNREADTGARNEDEDDNSLDYYYRNMLARLNLVDKYFAGKKRPAVESEEEEESERVASKNDDDDDEYKGTSETSKLQDP